VGNLGIPLAIQHVRNTLVAEFEGEFSADAPGFFGKALAAKAVQILTGRTTAEAVSAVTDGHDDLGVDAVTYSVGTNELWLVQAKWSEKGRAVFSVADAARLIHGFRALDNSEFDRMNARLQTFADQVRRMLTTPDVRVHLVAAAMAESGVARTVRDMIDAQASELPYWIDFRVLSAADFHVAVRDHLRPGPVSIEATFADGWFAHEHPYRSYVGIVKGSEVARWYLDNGPALMGHNARRLLAADEVSENLLASPLKNPDHFLFFNNGLTVMCDGVVLEPLAAGGQTEPVRLHLTNAVIVNGAQTTLALYRTYESNPGSLADLRVMLRVVVTEGTPDGFTEAITAATNTQRRMEPRDFVALDELQVRIREDFKVSLNKDYTLRRGQPQPAPETGCAVDEAALALACAHPDPALISRALSSTDYLWQHAPDGAYTDLFGHRPSARVIWHSVQRLRSLRKAVHEHALQLNGRLAAIAEQGELVIAHILFQRTSLKDDVPAVLSVLKSSIDNHFGSIGFISAVFGSPARCIELITAAVSSIDKAQEQGIDV
jgi:AIPR protein